jgi:O-antigen/teichoic acid export membrane protein
MGERIIGLGVTFLITSIVARYLGPEQFGLLSYSLSVLGIGAILGHIGLNGLIVRELSTHPEIRNEIMGSSFGLKLAGYLVGFIALISYTLTTEKFYSVEFWLLIILAPTLLFQPFTIIEFWFQSRLQAKYTAMARTFALVSASIVKGLSIILGAHLLIIGAATVLQIIMFSGVLVILYSMKSNDSLILWKFSKTKAREFVAQGWMVFIGSIFAVIYFKVDQVMLKWFINSKEVGIYAVAAQISEVWYFIPAAIVMSLFPKLIELSENNHSLYLKRLQQIFDILFWMALLVAASVTYLAKPFILLLFGEAYIGAAQILAIHIWAGIFIFMRALFSKWILIEKVFVFSIITQGIGALSNVVLNYFLIPEYGGIGAAYATLISYSFASFFALSFTHKTRPIFRMMSKSFLAPVRFWYNR